VHNKRLNDLKAFVRSELSSARFRHNPLKHGLKWFIALTLDVDDGHKLDELMNKWREEDQNTQHAKIVTVWE